MRADDVANGSLDDHLGWGILLRIMLYFEKLISNIVTML